ncbi:hypothetical protein [Pseudarthrobacter albicanus]|uniref:hypothetical protein n=1 Tax=Pseudarthrobacter albicanus TaxID=2823873 RepID=UPI001BA90954|nr:hypothetical protein [Pseudarthrobacter albicanus]
MDEVTGTRRPRRRWWIAATVVVLVAVLAVPAAGLAHFMMTNAVGRTTVVKDEDGEERTVYWRDYPGVAGLDPDEILRGPTAEEGYAAGMEMVADIRAALARELELEWAPGPAGQDDVDPFHERTQNDFGGESILTLINAPPSQSTSVPTTWAGKQRALEIIGGVLGRHGYSAPVLDRYDLWTDEDRVRELGGATPETQVIVSGSAEGPAGQWLSFMFQDLSKDTQGRFEEGLRPPPGAGGQPDTLSISYGANGLIPGSDREEFKNRLKPFAGLAPPPP